MTSFRNTARVASPRRQRRSLLSLLLCRTRIVVWQEGIFLALLSAGFTQGAPYEVATGSNKRPYVGESEVR